MKKQNYIFFVIIVALAFLNLEVYKFLITNEELIYNFYSEQLVQEQIAEFIEQQKKWEWLSYAAIPLLIFIRITLVAITLSVGDFLYNINKIENSKYKEYLKISLIGEFVLIIVGYFKTGYFYLIKTDYTLLDLQQYYPLSFTNLIDLKKIQPWLIYPLQTVNLFEIVYFFVLVYGMYKLNNKKEYWRSFEITAVSYGTGLIIWLGFIMFLTLNMT